MKDKKALFSSESDEWYTPKELFDELDNKFGFTLDPSCTNESRLCDKFYTKETDGLSQDWSGERVFCNPPYSDISKWVAKCYYEGHKDNTLVCLLIPSRTDTKYFHNYIYQRSEIRFVKGRLTFSNKKRAPFPSMLVIFRGPNTLDIREKPFNKKRHIEMPSLFDDIK